MKRRAVLYVLPAALAVLAFTFTVSLPGVAAADSHAYVGESKCEDCHDSKHETLAITDGKGNKTDAITVWQNDPHHGAFDALTSDWGKTRGGEGQGQRPASVGFDVPEVPRYRHGRQQSA